MSNDGRGEPAVTKDRKCSKEVDLSGIESSKNGPQREERTVGGLSSRDAANRLSEL